MTAYKNSLSLNTFKRMLETHHFGQQWTPPGTGEACLWFRSNLQVL